MEVGRPILIGRPFLKKHHAIINMDEGTLTVGEVTVNKVKAVEHLPQKSTDTHFQEGESILEAPVQNEEWSTDDGSDTDVDDVIKDVAVTSLKSAVTSLMMKSKTMLLLMLSCLSCTKTIVAILLMRLYDTVMIYTSKQLPQPGQSFSDPLPECPETVGSSRIYDLAARARLVVKELRQCVREVIGSRQFGRKCARRRRGRVKGSVGMSPTPSHTTPRMMKN